jgi:hypothetical protein
MKLQIRPYADARTKASRVCSYIVSLVLNTFVTSEVEVD